MSWNAISEQSVVCPPQGLSGPAIRRWLRSGGSRDAWLFVWTSLLKRIHWPGTEAATIVEEKVISSLPSSASYSSVSIPTHVHGSTQFLVGSRCCGASLMACAGRSWSRRRVWCSAASRHHSQQRRVWWLTLLLNMPHFGSPGQRHNFAWPARAAAHGVWTPQAPALWWEETYLPAELSPYLAAEDSLSVQGVPPPWGHSWGSHGTYTGEHGPSPALCLGGLPSQQVPGPRAKMVGQRKAEESLPPPLLSLHQLLLTSISK